MGRHSSPSQGRFYRSVIMWFLPWVVIAVVAVAAVWLGVSSLGGDAEPAGSVAQEEPTREPSRRASAASPSPTPSQSQTESSPSPSPEPTKAREPKPPKLITEGVTVQVLNGTATPDAGEAMTARLSDLGYTVVATEGSSAQYTKTTVFWSVPEAQRAAEALAERFGWRSGEKPGNLSDTVSLHVVVGADEV